MSSENAISDNGDNVGHTDERSRRALHERLVSFLSPSISQRVLTDCSAGLKLRVPRGLATGSLAAAFWCGWTGGHLVTLVAVCVTVVAARVATL